MEASRPPPAASGHKDPIAALVSSAEQHQEVYLWPENVSAWRCWQSIQTQWRTGVSGITGLDYAAVIAYLKEVEPDSAIRLETFDSIREAERQTLEAIHERNRI